jgi:ankyrin repeat protein
MMESDEDEEQDPLIDAIKRRDVDEVRRLLVDVGDVLEHIWDKDEDSDTYGWYALHVACYQGNTEIVRMLLDAGADPNRRDEFGRRTPLMVTRSPEIASMLLDAGADIVTLRDAETEETALDIAIRHRNQARGSRAIREENQAMVELLQRVQLERDRQRIKVVMLRDKAHYERMKTELKIFVKRGGTVPPRSVKKALRMAVEDDDLEVLHAILNQF